MPDVQVTIRLRREARDYGRQRLALRIGAACVLSAVQIGFNNAAQEIRRRGRRAVAAVIAHG